MVGKVSKNPLAGKGGEVLLGKGKKFRLTSCHRLFETNPNLIAYDHGIATRDDEYVSRISEEFIQFKSLFEALIDLNGVETVPEDRDDG